MHLKQFIHRVTHHVPTVSAHSAYESWAPRYDQREDNAFLFAEEQAFIPLLESLSFAGKRVLDFGCGTGRHLVRCLNRQARALVGIDFSRPMLMQAASKSRSEEPFTLLEGSVDALPFQDSEFDVGISALVLSHCADLSLPISEMSRVLRQGAVALVSDWHPENDKRGWKRSFETKADDGSIRRFAARSHRHSLIEYQHEFRQHGLVVEQMLEPTMDASLEPIFHRTNMMQVYQQYAGSPLVVIFVLRKL